MPLLLNGICPSGFSGAVLTHAHLTTRSKTPEEQGVHKHFTLAPIRAGITTFCCLKTRVLSRNGNEEKSQNVAYR